MKNRQGKITYGKPIKLKPDHFHKSKRAYNRKKEKVKSLRQVIEN